jgi:hypothetical protein
MKKQHLAITCLAIALGLLAFPLSAQTSNDHQYEIGLRFSGINFDGFNSFSAIYKKKLAEGKYRRISGTFGGLGFANEFNRSSFSFNFGLSIGRENRRLVGKKTIFYTGPVFSINTGLTKLEGFEPNWNLQPSMGGVLGVQYDFNENWAINLETIPSGSISVRQFSGTDVGINASVGFSSNVTLSLMHKF